MKAKPTSQQRRLWQERWKANQDPLVLAIFTQLNSLSRIANLSDEERLSRLIYKQLCRLLTAEAPEQAAKRAERDIAMVLRRAAAESEKARREQVRLQRAAVRSSPDYRRDCWREYVARNRDAVRARDRLKNRHRNIMLPDHRVREKIVAGTQIDPARVPPQMIAIKRISILINRELRKTTHALC